MNNTNLSNADYDQIIAYVTIMSGGPVMSILTPASVETAVFSAWSDIQAVKHAYVAFTYDEEILALQDGGRIYAKLKIAMDTDPDGVLEVLEELDEWRDGLND